jgi:spermidine synthase
MSSSIEHNRLPQVTISESLGTRYLHLGTPWIQGAMQIRKPNKLVLEYIERMMAWLLFVPSSQWAATHAQLAQLGLGAASLTKYTSQVLRVRSTAVELNPQVVMACHRYFALPKPGGLLEIVERDAFEWIFEARNLSALMVDLYDEEAQAPVLDSPEFYALCRRAMQVGGAMTVNCFGGDSNFERSIARISASFEQLWCFEPTAEGNTIVIALASNEAPSEDDLKLRAASVASATDLPARKWIKKLKKVK